MQCYSVPQKKYSPQTNGIKTHFNNLPHEAHNSIIFPVDHVEIIVFLCEPKSAAKLRIFDGAS